MKNVSQLQRLKGFTSVLQEYAIISRFLFNILPPFILPKLVAISSADANSVYTKGKFGVHAQLISIFDNCAIREHLGLLAGNIQFAESVTRQLINFCYITGSHHFHRFDEG